MLKASLITGFIVLFLLTIIHSFGPAGAGTVRLARPSTRPEPAREVIM